jgi:heme-degrading monooxygenase HmoA
LISRQWRGLAKLDRSQDYIDHLRNVTFPRLQALPGFVDGSILRRELPDGVEFIVVTRWQSETAIEAFAGSNPDVAVVPDNVKEMMVDYDRAVRHYTIVQ